MIRFENKVDNVLFITLIIGLMIYFDIIVGLGIYFIFYGIYLYNIKKINRFKYIYKITDNDQRIKELEKYKEKGRSLDYIFYNTLCVVQIENLAFEDALSANEMMLQKMKNPTINDRLIYQNNKCLLLCYMKKYQELEELVEDFQDDINKSKRKKELRICMQTLLSAKINLALADSDIEYAKELLTAFKKTRIEQVDIGYAPVLYQAKIDYLEGNVESAKQLADSIIKNCEHRLLVYQAKELFQNCE